MLSLFKEQDSILSSVNGKSVARERLTSFLNKGLIPEWEDFFQVLPIFDDKSDIEDLKEYFLKLTKWTFLDEILHQGGSEFFFHGPDHIQRVSLEGSKKNHQISISEDDWQLWLEIISVRFKQNWNVQKPFVSFYGTICGQQFRLSLIHSSTSPTGISKLVLRSLPSLPYPLESFGETQSIQKMVKEKRNVLIAGSTGSGKTSFLGSLMTLVNNEEHIVILEDTYEIPYGNAHQTRFLAGCTPETSLKAYLSYSLRLSPDRIFLGEMRSHEVIPFLMAMNTGHRGLMGTIHSSSAIDAIYRLALLFSIYSGETQISFDKVMELITRNMEYVIFMREKKVLEVIKILGSDKGTPFFETVL
jgi:type IV secretory pathway ATPase VirB11/archaellum biosynthesis ATPase